MLKLQKKVRIIPKTVSFGKIWRFQTILIPRLTFNFFLKANQLRDNDNVRITKRKHRDIYRHRDLTGIGCENLSDLQKVEVSTAVDGLVIQAIRDRKASLVHQSGDASDAL